MAYMKDSTGRRLDSFKVAQQEAGSAAASTFLAKLRRGTSDVVFSIVSDSTGLTPSAAAGWPRKVAAGLAARFPAYTVRVKDWDALTAHAYGGWTTIQTGTGTGNSGGPFTLSIYNGAASGKTAAYPLETRARFLAMVPDTPDLIVVSMGHNPDGAAGLFYRAIHYPLLGALRDEFPRAGMLSTLQNPRRTNDAEYVTDLRKQLVIQELSDNMGIPTINVLEPWMKVPNYGTAFLADGVHPTAAGADFWAAVVLSHFDVSEASPGRMPSNESHGLWLPASAFSGGGTPSTANGLPSLILDNDTDTTIGAGVAVPSGWLSYDLFTVFTTPNEVSTAGQNAIGIRSRTRSVGGLGRSSVNWGGSQSSQGGWANNQAGPIAVGFPSSAGNGIWPVVTRSMISGITPTSMLAGIQILRVGTDAADTMTGIVHFLGAMLTRAS